MRKLAGLCAVVLAATLAGCAVPVKEGPGLAIPAHGDLGRAQQMEQAGNPLGAAGEYLALAREATAPQRADYQLQAAQLLVQGNASKAAEQTLKGVDLSQLSGASTLQWHIISAQLALQRHRPDEALAQLQMPPAGAELTEALLIRLYHLRARAYAMTGNGLESANELLLLEPLLKNQQAIVDNQTAIIQALSSLSDQALSQLASTAPPVLAGWLELTRIARAPAGAAQFQRQIAEWRKRFPDHPALPQTLAKLGIKLSAEPLHPHQIALLLPQIGQFADAAAALRDGFLAAYFAATNADRPDLRIYAVDPTGQNVEQVYDHAVEDGADLVVGPLDKTAVTTLARMPHLPVPTLALNQAELPPETVLPANLYQFGLAPEDEARQAAEKAWLDGDSRALVLVPEGVWGVRVADAFRDRWEALGGKVLAEQSYDPTKNDFSNPIRRLLNIDESQRRFQALAQLLGTDINFEPRRRQDADVIFLGAFPRQARLIRPQLEFYRAGDLPVVATSHVFTGKVDAATDRDMDGVLFADSPWSLGLERPNDTLRQEISRLWPDGQDHYSRLYAMGVDAYRLIPYLSWLETYPNEVYDGETGKLQIDEQGRVHRRLVWAQFVDGRPKVLGYAPSLSQQAPEGDTTQQPPPAPPGG